MNKNINFKMTLSGVNSRCKMNMRLVIKNPKSHSYRESSNIVPDPFAVCFDS